jgi:hypothetical protein
MDRLNLDYNSMLFYNAIIEGDADEYNRLYSSTVEANNFVVTAVSAMNTTSPFIELMIKSDDIIRDIFLQDMYFRLRLGDVHYLSSSQILEYISRILEVIGYLPKEFIIEVHSSNTQRSYRIFKLLQSEFKHYM